MHRILLLALLCLLALVPTSCKKAKMRAQLKELMGSTIVLPEKIECVYNGEVFPMPDSLRGKAKLIIYLDSTECASCRISHLETYHQLFHYSEESGLFEVVVLLSNIDLYGIPVSKYVSDQALEHPVYVDVENRFPALNPSIPADEPRLHAFLIDNTGIPKCAGDPTGSERMLQVFIEAVNKLTN